MAESPEQVVAGIEAKQPKPRRARPAGSMKVTSPEPTPAVSVGPVEGENMQVVNGRVITLKTIDY